MESLLEKNKDMIDNISTDAEKANTLLKEMLIEELDITKKIAYIRSVNTSDTKKNKEYEMIFAKKIDNILDREIFYQLIDKLFPGSRAKLNKHRFSCIVFDPNFKRLKPVQI